ncbi:hypothetical protein VP01_9675g2, partial [Puccinia sorghi]
PRRHWLLSGLVTPVQSINCDRVLVGIMPPRNCLLANVGGKMLGKEREFLVILTISNMYPKVKDDEEALLPSKVISLAACRMLDQDTFSICLNGIALIPRGYDAFLNISGHE